MLIANPAALRQYNERCHQISDQERQLAALEERRQLARATIDDVAVSWPRRCCRVAVLQGGPFVCARSPSRRWPATATHPCTHSTPPTLHKLQGRWLPRLKEVVASINAIFSENFQVRYNCAGGAHPIGSPPLHGRPPLPGASNVVLPSQPLALPPTLPRQSVGCAGDVVLHEAPEEDFEHYAIEIR